MENSGNKPPKNPSITTIKSSSPSNVQTDFIILKTDSLAERARKMNFIKKMRGQNSRENSREKSVSRQSSLELESDTITNRTPESALKEVEKAKPVEINTIKSKSMKNETKIDSNAEIKKTFEKQHAPKEKSENIFRKSTFEDSISNNSTNSSHEAEILQEKVCIANNNLNE